MTSRKRPGPHFLSWRWRQFMRLMLTPVLLPRLMLSAAFLCASVSQNTERSRHPAWSSHLSCE